MRIITLLLSLFLLPLIGFSQEEPRLSRIDFSGNTNEIVTIRLQQTLSFGDIQAMIRFRDFETMQAFIGKIVYIGEQSFIVPSIGFEYNPERDAVAQILRLDLRTMVDFGIIRIVYGSNNFTDHGVSTNFMMDMMGHFIRFGIASNNQYVGPRFEVTVPIKKQRIQNLQLTMTYLSNGNLTFGLRYQIGGKYIK